MIIFLPGSFLGGLSQAIEREIVQAQKIIGTALDNFTLTDGVIDCCRKEHWVRWVVSRAAAVGREPSDFIVGPEVEQLLADEPSDVRTWICDQLDDLLQNYDKAECPYGNQAVHIPPDDRPKIHWVAICHALDLFRLFGTETHGRF